MVQQATLEDAHIRGTREDCYEYDGVYRMSESSTRDVLQVGRNPSIDVAGA